MTAYKIIFISVILAVLSFFFDGNLVTLFGVPSSTILSFFSQVGGWISDLAGFGDLILLDGTLLKMIRFGFYFGFFYVNFKFLTYLFKLFQ